jgi:uncharacterized membrane protein
MIEVTLYSRKDCHLCDQAKGDLEAIQAQIPHQLVIIDVDSSDDLRRAYGSLVPVIEVGPYRLKAPFSQQELQMTLGAAADRLRHMDEIEKSPALQEVRQRKTVWTKADTFSYWFTRHYLAVFNLFVFIYVGLPFLAPALAKVGDTGPANLIYRGYSMVCHQLAFRSFFLFGEQSAYPRAAANVSGILTFQQATGMSEASTNDALFAARGFIGNDAVGYKIALCERDVAIYLAILLFGLLYPLTGRRLPALPWYLWVLIGLAPIGVDGFSQLLSQPPFSFWAFRESTPLLRVLTGGLFGFATAWFGYPLVEETMAESRQIMTDKLLRVKKSIASSLASHSAN